MSCGPQNPLDEAVCFDEAGAVLATEPGAFDSPEMDLLGSLEASGATFPSWPLAVAIVADWMQKNCDTPSHDPEQGLNQRATVAQFLKFLIAEKDIKHAVARAHLAAFHLGLSHFKTAKEISAHVKLTEGRVSQIGAELKKVLDGRPVNIG